MATLQDHIRLTLLIDGNRQLKLSKINGKIMSQSQAIETLEGLIGKTPGSGRCTFSGTASVPATGPEFDFWSAVHAGSYHVMQAPLGAKSYIGNGWFDEAELDQSVNGAAEFSFTWTGEFAPLK